MRAQQRFREAAGWLATGLAILFVASTLHAEPRSPLAPVRMPEAAREGDPELQAALDQRIDLACHGITIRQALATVKAAAPRLDIAIAPDLGPDSDPDSRLVDLAVPQIRIEDALRLIVAAEPDLQFVIQPGRVFVTTDEKLCENLVTATYPIDELLRLLEKNEPFQAAVAARRQEDTGKNPPPDATEAAGGVVAEFVKEMVTGPRGLTLDRYEGRSDGVEIRLQGRSLVIRLTADGHRQVRHLLAFVQSTLAEQARTSGAPPTFTFIQSEPEEVTALRLLLARKIDVDFKDVTPRAALEQLCKQAPGLVIVRHPQTSEDPAGDDKARFDFRARQVPVGAVLDLLMPRDWHRRPERGYVLIGEDLGPGPLPLRAYPLGGLVTPPQRSAAPTDEADAPDGFDWGALERTVMETVTAGQEFSVAGWSGDIDSATVASLGGVLFVVQTPAGHERVSNFLNVLISAAATKRPAPIAVPREETVWTTPALEPILKARVDADFKDTPLPKALESLAAGHPGLQILFDPRFKAEGTHVDTRTVTLKAEQQPLGEVLSQTLDDGLCFRPWCGYLLATYDSAEPINLSATIYPISDILGDKEETFDWFTPLGGQDILTILKQCVNATGDRQTAQWIEEGGPACASIVGRMLCVAQTDGGQSQVVKLLDAIRHGQKESAEEFARQKRGQKPRAFAPDAVAEKVGQPAPRSEATEPLVVVTYPVFEAFCGPYAKAHPAPAGLESIVDPKTGCLDLEELLMSLRQAATAKATPGAAEWTDEGGTAVFQYLNGVFIISQTRQGHARILACLQDLYKKRFP
jgi:hypothetical protein